MSLTKPLSFTQEPSKEKINNFNNKDNGEKDSNISKNTETNFLEILDIQKIKEFNSKCVEFIFEEKIDVSIEILKKIEIFLENNIIEPKFNYNKKLIIIILHNLACCYQKLKDYDNCIVYLDAVIYHFDKELEKKHHLKISEEYFCDNLMKDQSNYSLLGDLILELRFSAKFHLQMCAVLSQANKHIEALKHAKLARLICEDNLIKTYYLFIQMKLKNALSFENKSSNKANNNSKECEEEDDLNNSEKMKLTQKIIKDLFNKITNLRKYFYNMDNTSEKKNNNIKENSIFFYSYLKYRKNEIHKYQKNIVLLNNIRNVFGDEIKNDDWINLLNIGNIMYLSPLNEEDLALESDPKYELLRDSILEKVVMLTVSYFSIAMEMKQLSHDQNNKKLNGDFFHYLAVFFSNLYLPVSCPIVKHYINSYYKHYEKDLDIVPEGKIIDYKIDLIKNEIEINKDIQSFVRMQKINYTNNNNNNLGKINNINYVKINNKNQDFKNEITKRNVSNKKAKIPLGLKLSLNLDNILNKNNINENRNNSNSKNKKLSSSNDKKHLNKSNKKNIKNNNFNNIKMKNNDKFEIFSNNNNLNIAEKSKIKELPKFKLNFSKLNNLNSSNEESNPKEKEKNIQNIKSKIKKIQNRISDYTKVNRHSASKNKLKRKNFKKNKGYNTERTNSNKRSINISETLKISKKGKNKEFCVKRNSFINPYYNKHLSKTSPYQKKKSPIVANKGKIKGNLTDRMVKNKDKSSKKNNERIIKNKYYKNNVGYLTYRELSHFKIKEKINLNNNINSKNSKNKNKKKEKDKTPNQIKKNISLNKCINKLNEKIKNKQVNNIYTNNYKIDSHNKQNTNKKRHNTKDKNNLVDKLHKNLFLPEFKNNSNYIYNNQGNTKEFNKYLANKEKNKNLSSLIKDKNPFKN